MKHNIPLNILDEYAKTISSKQVKMLYESKCNKKFKKALYENMKYQNDNSFSIYLNDFTLDEAHSSVDKALVRYVRKHKLQYNKVSDGVYFYTPLEKNYISLLENLVQDGFDIDLLKENVDSQKATVYLEKLKLNKK